MTATLTIPSLYSVIGGDGPLITVEHADLPRTRLQESVIARALLEASRPERVVGIASPTTNREKHTLCSMLQQMRVPIRRGFNGAGCSSFAFGTSTIWLIGKANRKDLPFVTLDWLGICDAHLLEPELLRYLHTVSTMTTAVGAPARRGDVWYDFARSGFLTKIPAKDICERYPDQIQHTLDEDDPDYGRLMACDEDTPAGRVPFRVFARTRLKVRTDKTVVFLNEKQQREASEQHGTPVVTFDLSALQKRYEAAKRLAVMQGKKPWFLLLKYRRGGFTTLEQARNYFQSVTVPRSFVTCLADTAFKSARIFQIAKLYHEFDPRSPRLVGDSKTRLEFSNGSNYFIGTAGSSGFARGDTLQRAHGSEVAKWCDGDQDKVAEVMAGILGATEHGEIVLETTPNGVEWFATQYRDAKAGLNDYTPIFLRWFDDPANRILNPDVEELQDTLTDRESFLMAEFKLDWEQVAFRRDRKRAFGPLFPQEYPEDDTTCFLVSGTPFFDVEFLLDLAERMSEVPKKHVPGGTETRWEEPVPGVKYVLGADTSEGLSTSDPNGLGVMRKDTGAQVCSVHGLFNPRTLAEHIARVSKDYNDALIGIERENHGHAVIQKVVDLGINTPHYRGGQLYCHSRSKMTDKLDRVKKAGWSTNAVTRPVMLDMLSEWLAGPDPLDRVRDKEFVSECLTFRLQKNGKYSADPGAHDDSVMKWAVAEQMRQVNRPKPQMAVI